VEWQQTGSRPHQNRPLPFSNQHIRGLIIDSVVNVIDYFIFVVGVWFFGLDRQRKLDQPTNCLGPLRLLFLLFGPAFYLGPYRPEHRSPIAMA
jgi:hypothetical protein